MTDDEFLLLLLQAKDDMPGQTTFAEVVKWMRANAGDEKLQAYCTRKGAKCESGHDQIADCEGVLVTALHMMIHDLQRRGAILAAVPIEPDKKALLN